MIRLGRVLLEFLVIVAGVLVALGVGEWNDARRNHVQERVYLQRLVQDLSVDTARLGPDAPVRQARLGKETTLMQLLSSIGELDGDDASLRALANDLATVSQGAWANLPTSRVTFDELQTTGSLGLIRPVELRQQVAAYYQDFDLRIQRLDERITDFPRLAYGLVRREGEFEAAELTSQELRRLRQGVSTPGFAAALTAELNRTKTQTSNYDELYAEAVQLLKDLDTYLLAL